MYIACPDGDRSLATSPGRLDVMNPAMLPHIISEAHRWVLRQAAERLGSVAEPPVVTQQLVKPAWAAPVGSNPLLAADSVCSTERCTTAAGRPERGTVFGCSTSSMDAALRLPG